MSSRFDMLIKLSGYTGLTIDYWEFVCRGLGESDLAILCGNASKLPKMMKSIDSPYVSRSAMQLSSDGL